jgi:membrane protease YdiL (CAAX protease family)
LLSGFVFAAFHLSATTLIPLTLTEIAFAWAYARTGSTGVAILPHAGLNAIVFIVLVDRS